MYQPLTKYFEETLSKQWHNVLLESYSTKETISGQSLASYISSMHGFWSRLNIGDGEKIAMCIPPGMQWAKLFFAVFCSKYVPIALPSDINLAISAAYHSDCKILYIQRSDLSIIDICKFTNLDYIISIENNDILWTSNENTASIHYSSRSGISELNISHKDNSALSLIIYTSGTSTRLKGVMLSSLNLSSCCFSNYSRFPYEEGDSILSILPINHIFGLMYDLLLPICKGMRVVMLDCPPLPEHIIPALKYVQPSILFGVPVILYNLMAEIQRVDQWAILLSCKMITCGGAGVKREFSKFMIEEKRLPFYIGYGMSECSPTISVANPERYEINSCGMPIDCLNLRIDSNDPLRVPGEIQVKGDSVFIGYYKDEDLTRSVFTKDGWFKTSDIATISEQGNIFIQGRLDSQISSNTGKNIYLEDIERILCNSPLIKDAVVTYYDNKLKAFLVLNNADDFAVKSHIQELNAKKFCGVYITEVQYVEKIERTPKGSIKRSLYR